MDPQSPPKRMTRSRAAKASTSTEPTAKTTRIVTAAAKAKTARSTATSTPAATATATKRKTRSDDVDDEEDHHGNDEMDYLPAVATKTTRATRGRAKKPVEEPPAEVAAPAARARGRPKKAVEPVKEEPIKATRSTRTRKTQQEEEPEEEAETAPEPVKKTTRSRAVSSAATKPAAKATVKKSVKFEEPEKENILPAVATRGKAAATASTQETGTGLRAKPVRRGAAAATASATGTTTRATRATRSASTSEDKETRPSPLSPKKVTQMAFNRADSEDELAISEKTPLKMKPVRKHTIKPAATKAAEMAPPPKPEETTTTTNTMLHPPELGPSLLLGTPARRGGTQSPWKDSMKSPARRVEGLPTIPQSASRPAGESAQPQFKASLLQSPAKRPASPIKGLEIRTSTTQKTTAPSLKNSLFSSPAKRPMSSIKFPPKRNEEEAEETLGCTPAPKPTLLSTPAVARAGFDMHEEDDEDEVDQLRVAGDDVILASPTRLQFPGRLSAVLPRHADPALKDAVVPMPGMTEEDKMAPEEEELIGDEEIAVDHGDPMVLDEHEEPEAEEHIAASIAAVPLTAPKHRGPMFGLRAKDRADLYNDAESESEDELAPSRNTARNLFGSAAPSTPSLGVTGDRTGTSGRSTTKRARLDSKFGFTPLAHQLSGWTAGPSPLKTGIHVDSPEPEVLSVAETKLVEALETPVEPSPVRSTFFEDEMIARDDVADAVPEDQEVPLEAPIGNESEVFIDDIPITHEDAALAAEANEMSLLEPEQVDDLLNDESPDDSLSECSQEYGDENEIPIDPSLLPAGVPPATPQRFIRREFHTVSKVPLKAADDSTPRPRIKKRSHSISRLPVQRPSHGLTRNATVISYSPMKRREETAVATSSEETDDRHDRAKSAPPVTPSKSEVGWSTAGTPARTPRRDLNPALLSGAVVHVDVHTSEGADASGIFVELLTQMGARCVKSWSWSPSSPPGKEGSSSKIGITHVVYKDGGVRTLEKVRETGGVVQCVGVSWVLDCERENQWLDEAPYYIDTSMVPRGGARRRKSMEPKALANLNGMVIPTPMRAGPSQRECQTAPTTPAAGTHQDNETRRRRRRDSSLWVLTPSDKGEETFAHDSDDEYHQDENADHDDSEWDAGLVLTPVPKTPAPEAIARYAQNISPDPETPSEAGREDEEERHKLLMRTAPPKQNMYVELGEGILSREKDENVLMRLMAARRKSLQHAPKVGSPLAKTWA